VREHISYSEFKVWNECAFQHKLKYIDGIESFTGNAFTAFGTAIHSVCEEIAARNTDLMEQKFLTNFEEELSKLLETNNQEQLISDMRQQGVDLLPFVLKELEKKFPNFELVAVEEELFEDFEDFGLKFKGFIDLIIKTTDGKYHIIDWKTCSWGWDAQKKSDKIVNYQLIFYKWFWANKHNIPLKNIECHFGLLKRTANKDKVEVFRITSGQKKIDNALTLLRNVIINIQRKKYFKNRLSCKYCPFFKTEHCK
jgi:hypothetical protein